MELLGHSQISTTLIDQLTNPYDPTGFKDNYRLTLKQVIEAKLTSQEPVTAAPAPAKGKVTDLMEALRASISLQQGAVVPGPVVQGRPRTRGRGTPEEKEQGQRDRPD